MKESWRKIIILVTVFLMIAMSVLPVAMAAFRG